MIVKVQYRNCKKYIKLAEPCFSEFVAKVKSKFTIPAESHIDVTDNTGTEIDEDVFPDLVTTLDSCFVVWTSFDSPLVASSPVVTDTRSMTPSSSIGSDQDSVSSSKRARLEGIDETVDGRKARDMVREVLSKTPGGAVVMEDYKQSGGLSDSSRRKLVNILAAHMTEQEGRIPCKQTKEITALGIITLFPALKDPFSKKGYEHFYDSQSGTGFLSWRLKTIQRKTRPRHIHENTENQNTGGPAMSRDTIYLEDQLQGDQCREAISLMNHSNNSQLVLLKMRQTFQYRQCFVHDQEKSTILLKVFPRFLDIKGLVLQDFSLLFGEETASKFLQKWSVAFKDKVIREARTLPSTPFLQKLLNSANVKKEDENLDNSEWDSDMASLLLLLHLLAPQPGGRKKTLKISVRDAADRLVKFHKSCPNLDTYLAETETNPQPYLLAIGTTKADVHSFYVVMDKSLIPCQSTSSLAAFDELFKAHFVFCVKYEESLCSLFTFIQTTVYNIDVGTTRESPKVRELRAKLLNKCYS
ncbi:uncharacterized protein LOC114659647 [Erpetoichthys calabaricus]|uniref:uncharacterized protein LOC114659647 n=1 Tax=Erpetoichthys calabaricus TaxID=27687 RepID=UPI0010A0B9B1|nr:uncharacterized protein LOC114659647 [Erpetoichthys calabaricus]